MYIAHCGDSGAVMACTSYDLHFPLRLTTDHKPNRADEHARIQAANGNIDEQHNRVVSEPKPHNGRVTLLSMSRWVCDSDLHFCSSALSFKCLFRDINQRTEVFVPLNRSFYLYKVSPRRSIETPC